jgi:hypothetical protein
MSDYQARAGSTADLTLRHLRAHGATGEIALAAAIDKDVGDLGALLNWPIKQGAIKKAVVGDEWVYDLGDGVPVAQPIELPKKTPQQGANRDASAGQSHGAGGSESLAGRGTNGAPALGAAPVFSMQASRAGPASDGSQKPNGRAHGSSTAPVRAGSDAAVDEAPSDQFRIALWSDGVLDIRRPGGHLTRFTRAEARAIVNYLESISLDPLREEGAP